MENAFKYFAFISYKRDDEEWAEWLQEKLEYFKLPSYIKDENPDIPDFIRPVFRDKTDLSVGLLSKGISEALANSKFLIVICSRHTPQSEWVNKEIRFFASLGRQKNIIPFITDGTANAADPKEECLPQALKEISQTLYDELLGANIHELSRDYAVIKVISRMLNIQIDKLWQRYLRAEELEKQRVIEEKTNLQRLESQYLAEKANHLTESGDSLEAIRLCLQALPHDLNDREERPFVIEAEAALRKAVASHYITIHGTDSPITDIAITPDEQNIISISENGELRIWSLNGTCLHRLQTYPHAAWTNFTISPDHNFLAIRTGINSYGILCLNGLTWKTYTLPNTIADGNSTFYLETFSPDNRNIIIEKDTHWKIINIQEQSEVPFPVSNDLAEAPVFSPDNHLTAAFDIHHTIFICSRENGRILLKRSFLIRNLLHRQDIHSIYFTPDSKALIIVSDNANDDYNPSYTYLFWDITSNHITYRLKNVSLLKFSLDNRYTLVVQQSRNLLKRLTNEESKYILHLYDNINKKEYKRITCEYPISDAGFSQNGKEFYYIYNLGKTLCLEDTHAQSSCCRTIEGTSEIHNEMARLKGYTIKATAAGCDIQLWRRFNGDYSSFHCNTSDKHPISHFYAYNLFLSENAGIQIFTLHEQEKKISIFHIADSKNSEDRFLPIEKPEQREYSPTINYQLTVISNPDYFVCYNRYQHTSQWEEYKGEIELWFLHSQEKYVLQGHHQCVTTLSFNKKGNILLSGSTDHTIRIWDITTKSCLKTIQIEGSIHSVAFSDDEQSIFVLLYSYSVITIDRKFNKQTIRLKLPSGLPKNRIDNTMLLNGKNGLIAIAQEHLISVTNLYTGHSQTINTPDFQNYQLAFSPNGTLLASTSKNAIRIWQIDHKICLKEYQLEPDQSISSLVFSPNGEQLFSVAWNGIVTRWELPPLQKLIDKALLLYQHSGK